MRHGATLCLAALLAAAPGVCAPPTWTLEESIPNDRKSDKAREWGRKSMIRVRNNFIAGQGDDKLRASLIDAYLTFPHPAPNLTAEHRLSGRLLHEWVREGKPAVRRQDLTCAVLNAKADEEQLKLHNIRDLLADFQERLGRLADKSKDVQKHLLH